MLRQRCINFAQEHFARLAVDAVLRLRGSDNLDYIQLIKKPGGSLRDSYLAEGFVLDKKIGIGQPRCIKNARVMVANTAMDSDNDCSCFSSSLSTRKDCDSCNDEYAKLLSIGELCGVYSPR